MARGHKIEIDTSGTRDFDKGHDKNNTPVAREDTESIPVDPKITGKGS